MRRFSLAAIALVFALLLTGGAGNAWAATPQSGGPVDLFSEANINLTATDSQVENGWKVSRAGDINDDGIGDLLVGLPYDQPVAGRFVAGHVYVVYGSASLADINLTDMTQAQGFAISGAANFDELGAAVSGAGDFNGDGVDDILLGAPGAIGGGRIYIVYGSSNPLALTDLDLTDTVSGRFISLGGNGNDGDRLGETVAELGDVNGDGATDIGIAAPGADPSGRTDAGAAYIVYGDTFAGSSPDALGYEGSVIEGAQAGNQLNDIAPAGNYNSDGYRDIAVSSAAAGSGGTAWVISGQAGDIPAVDLQSFAGRGQTFTGAPGYGLRGLRAAGDVDGDGNDDLIVGAPDADIASVDSNNDGTPDTPAQTNAGYGFVFYGGATVPANTTVEYDSVFTSGTGTVLSSFVDGARLGDDVAAAGDYNGDGLDDVLISAPNIHGNAETEGAAYLIYGRAMRPGERNVTNLFGSGFRMDGEGISDLSGAGDITADGRPDLLVYSIVSRGSSGGPLMLYGAIRGVAGYPLAPNNITLPSISGSRIIGQPMTADPGTWGGTQPISYSYQWRRCNTTGAACSDIAGATSSTYTPTSADNGQTLRVVVQATNSVGTTAATSDRTLSISNAAPTNTVAPAITGTARETEPLQVSNGSWDGSQPITYDYQWQRCDEAGSACVNITNATTSTYTPVAADVGFPLRAVVTATNGAGSVAAPSAVTVDISAARPTNTAAPTITGSAQSGQTLTAGAGTWTGSQPITYAYQWQRCDSAGANCDDIGFASGSTYTLTDTDIAKTIRVNVTATNSAGSRAAVSAQTAVVGAQAPLNTTSPAISGTARDGSLLTTTNGTFSGSNPKSYSYQWQREVSGVFTDISGATNSYYQLGHDDYNTRVRVRVTASNAAGSDTANSNPTATVAAEPTASSSPPLVTGTPRDGQTLTSTAGNFTGTPPLTRTYQWQRCNADLTACGNITGATSSTYTADRDDITYRLRSRVTATGPGGSDTGTSTATSAVTAAPPVNTALPAVTGTARQGQTINVSDGTWTGTTPLAYSYQWQRCNSFGSGCVNITGAVDSAYVLATADAGKRLRALVTAANSADAVTAESATTAVVEALAPTNATPPTITGTARDGQTLTANPGTWDGAGTITYSYQWQRTDGSGYTNIAGATSSAYALTAEDVNSSVRVIVFATNSGGTSDGTASSAAGPVDAAPPVTASAPALTGTARDGQTLSVTAGTWDGTSPFTYTYQWERCTFENVCTTISGASGSTYTLTSADIDRRVRATVTAGNSAGQASRASNFSGFVQAVQAQNTTAPTISGTAAAGRVLTADKGEWTGSDPITYAYQWQRCTGDASTCTAISGANTATYTLKAADVGATVRVRVTAANPAPLTTAAFSDQTATVAADDPRNTAAPTISGVAAEGRTLTGNRGEWDSAYFLTYSYDWLRCNTAGGACTSTGTSSLSYLLGSADIGTTLRLRVTATDAGGTTVAQSQPTAPITAIAPSSEFAPTVTGTAQDGQTLTARPGQWKSSVTPSYSYQWQRSAGGGFIDIPGATSTTHQLTGADVGRALRVVVTAANSGGSAQAASTATSAVAALAPRAVAAPTVSGANTEGGTLNATAGAWTGSQPISHSYQWQRETDGSWVSIPGATAASYRVSATDRQHSVRVQVTGRNAGGADTIASNAVAIPDLCLAAAKPKRKSITLYKSRKAKVTITPSWSSRMGSRSSLAFKVSARKGIVKKVSGKFGSAKMTVRKTTVSYPAYKPAAGRKYTVAVTVTPKAKRYKGKRLKAKTVKFTVRTSSCR